MKKAPSELLSRRQLISFMGVTTGMYMVRNPMLFLLQNVIDGMVSRAIAAESGGVTPRNYVFIGLPGAPSRWHFDQILKPDTNAAFVDNGSLKTAISSSGTSNSYSYQTVNHASGGKNIGLPPIWGTNVQTSTGPRAASQLLSNALFMRGCDLKQDGHPTNYVRQVRANGGGASLSGLVADASTTSIPAVSNLPFGTYGSLIGTPEVQLSSGNPVSELMSPFNGFSGVGFRQNDAQKQAVDVALQAISQYSLTNNPGAASLFSTRRNAEKLIRTQFGDLAAQWNTLYSKYNNAIAQTVQDASAGGLMNSPIFSNGNAAEFNFFTIQGNQQTLPNGMDLRTIVNGQTNILTLAVSLALTEYVLTNGISASVSAYSNPFVFTLPNGSQLIPNHDQHTAGVAANTYQSTLYYRGLSAGLLELVTALKGSTTNGTNLYENTVVHVAGDFCRSPRNDGSGSDHGFNANCAAVFSGALPEKLQVVGNIATNTGDPTYTGTWGVAGNMDYLSGRTMGIGNIASTISDLLRVSSPTPNDSSLFPKSESFQTVDEAKNV